MGILKSISKFFKNHFHFRSAVTGKFIKEEQAKANPKETVKETHKPRP
jgi:hypothetical protein